MGGGGGHSFLFSVAVKWRSNCGRAAGEQIGFLKPASISAIHGAQGCHPDGCQALTDYCAEDAVVPRLGDGSVRGGCSGASHRRESCAPGDFGKLFQPRARTGLWMQEVLWRLRGGAPGLGDDGTRHSRSQGRDTSYPALSAGQSPASGTPGCSGPREVTQAYLKGLQGDRVDISLAFVLGFFSPTPFFPV